MCYLSGLSLSFKAPVALIFRESDNKLVTKQVNIIVSTTGKFTCSLKGPSCIGSHNRWCGVWPLLTVLLITAHKVVTTQPYRGKV